MFLDEVRIFAASGKGGDGVVHFRREKYVPRGGPDGGDGGKGGDVILLVDPNLNTLSSFRRQRHFRAEAGGNGGGSNKTGRNGEDCVIRVPPGTVVKDDEAGQIIGDLVETGQHLAVCKGGRGGRGNARFASSKNQAPRVAEKGEPGEERWLQLELRLIADVGIVGMPNAGKSTFLAAVSNARPKIAAYPFTTLQPNLGVVELDPENVLVLADIPGLIEGAHTGAGLGFQFLRHIRRTRVLLHLIDGTSQDPMADFSQVNAELALYDERLSIKPQIVAVNKLDLPGVKSSWPDIERRFRERGYKPYAISALAREGLREVLYAALSVLQRSEPAPEPEPEALPVYRLESDPEAFKIARTQTGDWRVIGKAIERAAAMTYWEYDESVRRFQRLLDRLGIEEALRRAGAQSGDTVLIGEYELEWQE
jgi:GTP-binding protein